MSSKKPRRIGGERLFLPEKLKVPAAPRKRRELCMYQLYWTTASFAKIRTRFMSGYLSSLKYSDDVSFHYDEEQLSFSTCSDCLTSLAVRN